MKSVYLNHANLLLTLKVAWRSHSFVAHDVLKTPEPPLHLASRSQIMCLLIISILDWLKWRAFGRIVITKYVVTDAYLLTTDNLVFIDLRGLACDICLSNTHLQGTAAGSSDIMWISSSTLNARYPPTKAGNMDGETATYSPRIHPSRYYPFNHVYSDAYLVVSSSWYRILVTNIQCCRVNVGGNSVLRCSPWSLKVFINTIPSS